MYTNIEILSNDAFENIITALRFSIDKTILFGTEEQVVRLRSRTERFLKEVCLVREVSFVTLALYDMESAGKEIRREMRLEAARGSHIFGDVTGGDGAYVACLGSAAEEMDIPLHFYDIKSGRLTEMETRSFHKLSGVVPARRIPLTLETYIAMYGGKINHFLGKHDWCYRHAEPTEAEDALWRFFMESRELWNPFCAFLSRYFKADDNGRAECSSAEVRGALPRCALKTETALKGLLRGLCRTGVIRELVTEGLQYTFRYDRTVIPEGIWLGGGLLEYHIFLQERAKAEDCMVGVHIDWDGVISPVPGTDVLNEIDVLKLSGNVPSFISCKTGKADAENPLKALYELQTVAERFGGKHAEKILYVEKLPGIVHRERAKSMGIEIRSFGR